MPHALEIVSAWMDARDFAISKAEYEEGAGYHELAERWTQKSIRCELQAVMVAEMVDKSIKSSCDLARAA